MGRLIHYCLDCGSQVFAEFPCGVCGYDPSKGITNQPRCKKPEITWDNDYVYLGDKPIVAMLLHHDCEDRRDFLRAIGAKRKKS